jgi:hypothetical protein
MVSQRVMAIPARIVNSATLHLDCNYVQGGVVVSAASLWVHVDSMYIGVRIHKYQSKRLKIEPYLGGWDGGGGRKKSSGTS